jgi:hypothetical protein
VQYLLFHTRRISARLANLWSPASRWWCSGKISFFQFRFPVSSEAWRKLNGTRLRFCYLWTQIILSGIGIEPSQHASPWQKIDFAHMSRPPNGLCIIKMSTLGGSFSPRNLLKMAFTYVHQFICFGNTRPVIIRPVSRDITMAILGMSLCWPLDAKSDELSQSHSPQRMYM